MVQVPSVVGKDVDIAKSELDKAGFKISGISYEENASYQKNLVIRITDETGKEVSAGSELEEGSNINIIVSKGSETSVTPEPDPEPDDDSGYGDSENGSETTGDNSSQE